MKTFLGVLSFMIMSVAAIGAASAADGACDRTAAAPFAAASAAEIMVQEAVQYARAADPATATIINASFDGPQAGCSLCLENCVIDCFTGGGSNCVERCRLKCRNEGPPC